MVANLFTCVGSFYAIGLVIVAFIGSQANQTNIVSQTFAYSYFLMGISIFSLILLMIFSAKAMYAYVVSAKEDTSAFAIAIA